MIQNDMIEGKLGQSLRYLKMLYFGFCNTGFVLINLLRLRNRTFSRNQMLLNIEKLSLWYKWFFFKFPLFYHK